MQPDLPAPDDELMRFAADGAAPLPAADVQGEIVHDGARIWYASFGAGPPVVLLHGGLGHSGNWGAQVPAILAAGQRAIVIDSRGHGRSTRDAAPYRYDRMADDVLAVLDTLGVAQARFVGWSDGAVIALLVAARAPARATGVVFFGCNMDPGGAKPFVATPVIERCFARHAADYARLSATPDGFAAFVADVTVMMRTQPDYTAADLRAIGVPVVILHAEHDELIRRDHAEYLAHTLPHARFVLLPGVSHFAPLQRPADFNAAILVALATFPA